jgi:hypothetical protein
MTQLPNEFWTTVSAITVGRPSAFRQLHTEGKYAVFVKTGEAGQPDCYMIGRLPLNIEREFQPASAIASFSSEASAIETLKRWATDPLPPNPPPKPRKLGAQRRKSNRPRDQKIGAGQFQLALDEERRHAD